MECLLHVELSGFSYEARVTCNLQRLQGAVLAFTAGPHLSPGMTASGMTSTRPWRLLLLLLLAAPLLLVGPRSTQAPTVHTRSVSCTCSPTGHRCEWRAQCDCYIHTSTTCRGCLLVCDQRIRCLLQPTGPIHAPLLLQAGSPHTKCPAGATGSPPRLPAVPQPQPAAQAAAALAP